MEKKERLANTYLFFLLPAGIMAAAWAVYGFPVQRISIGLIALSVITVFFSSHFRIQLPRTKIHLTISDAMIMLSMVIYGGEVAVLMAMLETAFTSFSFRRKGVSIRLKTAVVNVMIGAIAVFITSQIVRVIFGSAVAVYESGDTSAFFWLLAVMTASLFLVNSILVSAVVATRCEKSIISVWNDYCVNALVMYLSGAALAGLAATALKQVNVILFAAVTGFFALIYLTYRRYVDDITQTSEKAENAERQRAEQAENHVVELERYVSQLEQTGRELEQSHKRFRHAAYHDALTGLPNRNYFTERLLSDIRRASDIKFAVLFLDLDRFKTINESLGHSMGDQLIKSVAKRLSNLADKNVIVGRFGGDEFAVIIPDVKNLADVTDFADRIVRRLAEPYSIRGREVFTSVSIGIALGSPTYRVSEDVLRDADIAMYYAKANEKSYVVFDQQMHATAVSRLQMETELRHAIENDEMELYYQPIVNMDNASLSGFEALIRWNHPERGLVSPAEFIPVSESTGLIVPMTIDILHKSCRQIEKWRRLSGNNSLFVSVNLSGKHVAHSGLVGQIKNVLMETGLAPSCLKLEITETAVMENAESAILVLNQIKSLGVRISIDDFGTGYSSLSYLHRFPIDTLKVDRSFVSAMDDGAENGEIVRTIVALAKSLKLSTVAEGIETVYQFHRLKVLGCDYAQGYLFSRPLPVHKVDALLSEKYPWEQIMLAQDNRMPIQNNDYSYAIKAIIG